MRIFLHSVKQFLKDIRGSISVEAVLAFPMLLWSTTAMYTFFDAYRAQNATYRANYTISDLLSRETNTVDANYINGLFKVFRYMTNSTEQDSWIRVTILHCVSDCNDRSLRNLDIDWSYGANGSRPLNDTDFDHYDPLVPLVAQSDRLILIETSMDYESPFPNALVSFPERQLVSHVSTRPRFAPIIPWDSTYNAGSGGNHSDDSEDYTNWDDDPDLPDDDGDDTSDPGT